MFRNLGPPYGGLRKKSAACAELGGIRYIKIDQADEDSGSCLATISPNKKRRRGRGI